MQHSLKVRVTTDRVSRVVHLSTLAERHLQIGHLDVACEHLAPVLDDYPKIQSGRADDRITTMLTLIRPHFRNPTARILQERARTLLPPPSSRHEYRATCEPPRRTATST